jgi:hypothetical protein
MRCEHREPRPLLDNAVDRQMNSGKPNRELVAEAVHRIVGARRRNPLYRKVGPLWMLRYEQATHQFAVGFDLVVVHTRLRHNRSFARLRTGDTGFSHRTHSARLRLRFRPCVTASGSDS